jgi:hypothetical protein
MAQPRAAESVFWLRPGWDQCPHCPLKRLSNGIERA